jgi:GrpB-like predicted nucleotidyltransferase (UPF0157 family)
MLTYSVRTQFMNHIPKLAQLGFAYKGDVIAVVNEELPDPDRHFFAFYNSENNIDFVHLHAVPHGHRQRERILSFRDKLRANPALVREYEDLKKNLQLQGLPRRQYTLAKDSFVERIVSE